MGLQHRAAQIQPRAVEAARQRQAGGIGQHRHRSTVLQLEGNTLGRIGRIDRHVAGTRLEDAEQADNHLQTALDTDRHPVIRTHAQGQQLMGDLVGAGIQLAIGQGAVFVLQRHGLRLRHRPGFERAMDQGVGDIRGMRGVPVFQQLLALARGQDIHAAQWRLRGLFQRLHQVFQGAVHIATDPLGADLRFGHDRQVETLTQVIHRQGQRVVGPFFAIQRLNAVPGGQCLVGDADIDLPVVEQRTEQRRRRGHATATLRQYQRGMLMGEQTTEPGMGGLQTTAHPLLTQCDPQRQGVDEHAQGTVGALAALQATQQHGAKHHVVLA